MELQPLYVANGEIGSLCGYDLCVMRSRQLVLLGVVTASLVSSAGLPADASEGWQTYHSPDYGFTVDHPRNMTFYPGHPDYKEITLLSFIPICDDTTVACFAYNGDE